jgi:hypothetical protein
MAVVLTASLVACVYRPSYPAGWPALSEHWYERGGPAGGWELLGSVFYEGVNTVPDYMKAQMYYLKAADLCSPIALWGLGALQAENRLPNRDFVEGYKWLLLAEWAAWRVRGCGSHGACVGLALKDERGYRKLLRSRLSPTEIAEAERRAEEWKARFRWERGRCYPA